jgi:VWFA-related protein
MRRLEMVRPLPALPVIVCAALATASAQRGPAPAPARTNTVYVSVTEPTGAPVLDLAPDDFAIKEDGKVREVLQAGMASGPLQIMIIVDDNGTGLFRSGLVQFVQQFQGRAEIALASVTGQTQTLVDYTKDVDKVINAVVTLTARPGTNDGGQLLEGIFQAARDQQKREARRPVIVALTVGGEEHSTLPAHHVLDQLARSGSSLYVIQVAGTSLRPTVPITQSRQLLGENLNLSEVLGEGPKQSGGWREEIAAAPGIVQGLRRIAIELKSQYAIAYARADKVRQTEKIDVSVKRNNVRLRAPSRVPGR